MFKLVTLALGVLSACASISLVLAQQTWRVGYIGENGGVWDQIESESFGEEAPRLGLELQTTLPSNSPEGSAAIETMVASGIDAIVVAYPRQELHAAMKSAMDAGIPVFMLGRSVIPNGEISVASFDFDYREEGLDAAMKLTASGSIQKVVELPGPDFAPATNERHAAFEETIRAQDTSIEMISVLGVSQPNDAYQRMYDVLAVHGDSVSAVYAHSPEMAIAAIRALRDAGRTPGQSVLVASPIYLNDEAYSAAMAGELIPTVQCGPSFASAVLPVVEAYLRTGNLPSDDDLIIVPSVNCDDCDCANSKPCKDSCRKCT